MKNKLTITITNEAKNDIEAIVSYIAIENKNAASKFANIIKKTFVYISDYPYIGKKRPEYTDKDILFFTIKWGYCIIYTIENKTIHILRILSEYQNYHLLF